MSRTETSRAGALRWALPMLLLLAFAAGCSSDDDSPAPAGGGPVTTMQGVMINGSENGQLTISIASATLAPPPGALTAAIVVGATATFRPTAGPQVNLTGNYDVDTDSLWLSGGGYDLVTMVEATDDPPGASGQYTGPNGPGFFGVVQPTAQPSLSVSCGRFSSDSTAAVGAITFIVTDTLFAGLAIADGDSNLAGFEGSVSGTGTMRSVLGVGDPGSDSLTIMGTLNTLTGQSTGTFTISELPSTQTLETGTWTAGPCP